MLKTYKRLGLHLVVPIFFATFAPKLNIKIMSRINDFETKLDKLIEEFSDVSNEDLADSLEYYSVMRRNRSRKEEQS